MTTISQLLNTKGSTVYSVTPETTVFEALQLMSDKNIGAVPVLRNKDLVGIFSERDYARQVVAQPGLPMTTPIQDIMTKKVRYIHPRQTLEDCMALMTEKRFRHLPVLSNENELIGIISIGDVVREVISKQEFLIEQLENYIIGA